MSPVDRREAQRRRAEARKQRRSRGGGQSERSGGAAHPEEPDDVGADPVAADEHDEHDARDVQDAPTSQDEALADPERDGSAEQAENGDRGAQPQPSRPPEQEREPVRGAPLDESLEVVRRAREHLQALQGHEAESVSSLERTSDGWRVVLEVVELARVPDSTDVMASYEFVLDEDKNVGRYTQARRYYRAQADRGDA